MALHIQMSEEAEAEMRKAVNRNRISSILSTILFFVLGGGLLYFITETIMSDTPPSFLSYTPPAEDAPPTNTPVNKQLTSKSSAASPNVTPELIVAQDAVTTDMAPVDISMDTSLDFGSSLDIGMGMGMGDLGDGLGSGGSGLGSGSPGGSALEGTFYDFKLTKSGAATGITEKTSPKTQEVLAAFLKNWSAGTFSKYYSSKQKLYASNFLLPSCKASYAPVAFKCQDKCKPSAWAVVYRGKVKAPKTGWFRFVGTGDDVLAVRFGSSGTVLEAGWCIPSMYEEIGGNAGNVGAVAPAHGKAYHQKIAEGKDPKHRKYEFIKVPGLNKWNNELGGLTAGEPFKVEEGKDYPIQILISEVPGGAFGFCLLIEELDSKGKPTGKNQFDLFRTNFSLPDAAEIQSLLGGHSMGNLEMPPYNKDSLIWTAVP